ncbi:MAG: type II toxin-antitoxin system RelE/ParE family toxin [Cyclobacteriaceae bacterium]|nr:MAG: type II toxin-antitoxin system RelE/ParE family toxin [Cyclobacteriaceae bacterium]
MVADTKPVIIWNKLASIYFKKAYERIKEDSYSNAEKVKNGIIKVIESLIEHPEKYSPDKFKKENPGNYRAFEKYSYRVAYKHTEREIRILRIRHVKQEPREY